MKAAVGFLLLTATLASPAAADIRVWTEKDRQGVGKEMRRAVRDLRNYGFDDRISSLETDEPWEVCSEPLYRGDCRIVQGVVLNLRELGLNNRITSMRKASEELIAEVSKPPEPERPKSIPPKTEKSTPRQSTSRKAEEIALAEAPPTSPKADEAAKAEPPQPTPRKAEEVAKAGPPPTSRRAEEVATAEPQSTPSKAQLTPPKDEDARAWRKTAPPPAVPSEPAPVTREWWEGVDDDANGPPQLELFEKPNYEGRRVRLEQAMSDLTVLDQPVGSLLVRSGSWQICSKPQFRGRCRTVDASSMGVPATPLIGSLRPEPD